MRYHISFTSYRLNLMFMPSQCGKMLFVTFCLAQLLMLILEHSHFIQKWSRAWFESKHCPFHKPYKWQQHWGNDHFYLSFILYTFLCLSDSFLLQVHCYDFTYICLFWPSIILEGSQGSLPCWPRNAFGGYLKSISGIIDNAEVESPILTSLFLLIVCFSTHSIFVDLISVTNESEVFLFSLFLYAFVWTFFLSNSSFTTPCKELTLHHLTLTVSSLILISMDFHLM